MSKQLPEGKYRARVKKWGFGLTKKDKVQFFLIFDVLGHAEKEADGLDGFDNPPSRTMYRALTEKTRDWLISDMRSLGYDQKTLNGIDPDDEHSYNFEGKPFIASVKYEDYEGKPQERWNFERGPVPVPQDKLRGIFAELQAAKDEETKKNQTELPESVFEGVPG